MSRRLVVTLELEVDDLSEDERMDGIFDPEDRDDPDMLPALVAELEPNEIGDLLPFAITSPDNEMFAGSSVYAKITSVKTRSSEWVDG